MNVRIKINEKPFLKKLRRKPFWVEYDKKNGPSCNIRLELIKQERTFQILSQQTANKSRQ